jgi:heat shock protein HslJ
MAQTQLNEMEDEDKIDFDSFSKSQSEVEKYAAGMARIISCSVITNRDNLPSAYLDNYTNFKFERYLKLKAEKRDSIITVIIPIEGDNSTGDLDYCYDWTGADSIDYLAGKRIPVKNINEDIFRVEKFNKSIYRFMPLSMIKKLMKKNIILGSLLLTLLVGATPASADGGMSVIAPAPTPVAEVLTTDTYDMLVSKLVAEVLQIFTWTNDDGTIVFTDTNYSAQYDCNTMSGTYEVNRSEVSFSTPASTRMACEEDAMDADQQLVEDLAAITQLTFKDGMLVMTGGASELTLPLH